MSTVIWSLEIAGVRRPLRTWGIARATLTRASMARDELSITVPSRPVAADELFPYGARVVLWRNEVRWFTGLVITPTRYGSGQSLGHTYVVAGPWWYLENKVFEEERFLAENPSDADSPLVKVFSSRAVLFNDLNGGAISPSAQATQAVAYARAAGAYLAAGSIALGDVAAWEEATDVTCAEVFKRSARYSPDAVSWCGYTTERPTINAARRAALEAVTVALDGGGVVDWQVEPLNQERVPGVRFYFEEIVTLAQGGTRAKFTKQEAGDPNAFGAVIAVIELGGQGGENPEPIPADLASAFFSAVNTLNYGGKLRLKAQAVDGAVRPGKRLNLTGGRTEWATMGAPVQRTVEDLFLGTTDVEFGAGTALGAQAFADYLRYQRLRQKTNYLDARRTGAGNGSAVPSGAYAAFGGAGSGQGFFTLELCDPAGVLPPRSVRVFGTQLS